MAGILSASVFFTAFAQTQVFYSVGRDTSALYFGNASAANGTLTLSGSAADKIGLGDQVRVTTNRYYIKSRNSATSFQIQNSAANGGTPGDTVISFASQSITIYRAFPYLKFALDTVTGACDATHLNTFSLVGSNYVLNLACYGDGKDSLPAVVKNWTTGTNNYVRIFTPVASNEVGVSQRHDGKWNTSAYRLEVTNQMALKVSDDHVRVEGLQVGLTTTASFYQGIYVMGTGASTDIRISSNIVKGSISGSSTNPKAIENYSGSVTRVWNNIIYGFAGVSGTATGILTDFSTCSTYVYNNTIYIGAKTVGISRAAGFVLAKNNLVQSDSLCFSGTFDAASTNNLSSDATAPGGGARTGIVPTFLDTASKDYRLSPADGAAKNYGVDLSADAKLSFTTDIDGTARSGAWDIGADEASVVISSSQFKGQPPAITKGDTGVVVGIAAISASAAATVSSVTILETSAYTADSNLTNVQVWLSNDTIWDLGDNQIGAGSAFPGETATFTEAFACTTVTRYLIVRGNIAPTATTGLFEIRMDLSTSAIKSGLPLDFAGATSVIALPSSPTVNVIATITNDSTPVLSLYAQNADSMRVAVGVDTTVWLAYDTVLSNVDISFGGGGLKYVRAQFKNVANNMTGWVYDSVTYDGTAPTAPPIDIIATLTNDPDPAISIAGSSADSMRLALEADTATATWRAYNTSDSISIAAGGDGFKRVFAQYKDLAGNRTVWMYDSVTYDGTAPTPTSIMITDNDGYTNDSQPDLTISATGADSMAFKLDAGAWSGFEMYNGSKTNFDITTGGEGPKMVYVMFKDQAGNTTDGSLNDVTNYDVSSPTGGTISIAGGNAYTTVTSVTLTLSAANADSMAFSEDDVSYTSYEMYITSKPGHVLSGGDGAKTVYVRYKDAAGNVATSISDNIILDTQVPTGGTISIAGGAEYTTTSTVTLDLSAVSADSMAFSEDNITFGLYEMYAASKAGYILTGGDGLKAVYVKYKDEAGNEATAVSDDITYDGTMPAATSIVITDNGGYTNDSQPDLTISATGADSMAFKLDAGAWSSFEVYSGSISNFDISAGGDGSKTVYVMFKDQAGNTTDGLLNDITNYDATAPTSFSINIIPVSTNDADPLLALSATGADSMRLAQASDTAASTWKAFATNDSLDISGSDGVKRVFVQYKDMAGNKTSWVYDSVTYDGTAPTGPTINIIATLTTDVDPAIALGATGADSMRLALATDTASAAWKLYSTSDSINISTGGDGLKLVFVQYKDQIGNRTTWIHDSVTYDATAPTVPTINIIATLTSDSDPQITLGATGADSMRLGQSADTSSASWRGYATLDSLNIGGSDGLKKVYVQYKDLAGNKTAWVMDSVVYDGTVPSNTGTFAATYLAGDSIRLTWTASASADVESVMVRYSAGSYPINASSGTLLGEYPGAVLSDTAFGLAEKTAYYFAAFTKDTVGHWSDTSGTSRDSASIPDLTPPANVTNLDAVVLDSSSIRISWTPSVSADAESIWVRYDTTSVFPADSTGGLFWARLPHSVTSDTLFGLVPKKWYRISLFVKDSAGLWSAGTSSARDSAKTPDATPPDNVTGFTATRTTGDTVSLSWTPSASADRESLVVLYRTDAYPANQTDGTLLGAYGAAVSSGTAVGLAQVATYYFAAFVKDSSGNWSSVSAGSYDTAYVPDFTPPSAQSINIIATLTNDADPAISLSAVGADSMRLAQAADTGSAAWKLYATTDSINIGGSDGQKKVYVQYKDLAGNKTAWVFDSVTYDGTAPSSPSVVIAATKTNDATPALNLSAIGADSMRFALYSDTTVWRPYATSDSLNVSIGGDGQKRIYVQFKDLVNNMGAWAGDTVVYDATVPVVNAGTDLVKASLFTLSGSASDPTAGVLSIVWTKESGTGTVTFGDSSSLTSNCQMSADGIYVLRLTATDSAGNTNYDLVQVTWDATAPTSGTISIASGAAYTTSAIVSLALSATSVDSMAFSQDNVTYSAYEAYATTKAGYVLTGGEGLNTVYVKYKDAVGNISSAVSDSITYDASAPTGTSISIASGASYTTTATVTLALSATNADSMAFSQDAVTFSSYEVYSTTKAGYVLTGGEGVNTVYVKYKDAAGNIAAAVSDNITYDATAPTGESISIASGASYTTSTTVNLALSATNADSMAFSQDNITYSAYEIYATTKAGYVLTGGEGLNTVYVKYKDAAGNIAGAVSDNITYDSTAPTGGTISIASGALYTASTTVSLSLSATSADSMAFSQDNITYGAYEIYATTKAGYVLTGGEGLNTVYVKYKDAAGNIAAAVSDNITYDATAPTGGTISIASGAAYTTSATVSLALLATNADSMAFSQDNVTYSAYEAYATTKAGYVLTGGEGPNTVYVKYKDATGNISSAVSDNITYDASAPTGGTVSIAGGAAYTTGSTVNLALSATGADSMAFSQDNVTYSAYEVYATTKSGFVLTGGEGVNTVYVKYKDAAGNLAAAVSDNIMFDGTAPSSATIDIVAISTMDPDPAIILSAIGADSMRLALSADTMTTAWKPYGVLDSVGLSAGGSGLKRVYAQYKDLAGNKSSWVFDSVTYDGSIPSGSINIIATLTNDVDPAISFSAVNSDSMRIALASDTAAAGWKAYRTSDSIGISVGGDGMKKVYAQFKNLVGSRSVWVSDSVSYDGTAPTGISINVIPTLTNDADPALLLSATGASHMRLGLAADTAAAVWRAFATSDSLSISAGGDGTKKVFAQYKDLAGNVSAWVSDSVNYDGTAPSGSLAIVDDGGVTTDSTPAFTIAAGSTADSMRVALNSPNALSSASWKAFRSSDSLALAAGGNRIYAQLKDAAGNIGAVISDSTYYDCIAPTNLLVLSAAVLSPNQVRLAWNASAMAGTDADSVVVFMKTGDTIRTVSDAGVSIAARKAMGDSLSTISALNAHTKYSFAVIVRDLRGNWSGISQSGRATVTTPSSAPMVAAWSDTVISEKLSYSYQTQAQDADGDSLVYSLRSSPAGMSISPAGLVKWTPGNSDVGKQVASMRVSDLFGGLTDIVCTLTVRNVNDVPDVKTASGARTITEDRAYAETLAVMDPDAGDSLALSVLALPSWITVNRLAKPSSTVFAWALSGVPTNGNVGDTSISLVISDRTGASDTFACPVKVLNANDAPVVITAQAPVRAFEDSLLTLIIEAEDVDGNDSIRFALPVRPGWLTLGSTTMSNGRARVSISGTPTQRDTGRSELVVVAMDRANAADTLRLTVDVLDMNDGPETRIDTIVVAGGAARIRFSGTDDYTTALSYRYRLSDSAGVIDSGETASLVRDFYPLADGRYQVTIQAVDSARLADPVPAVGSFTVTGVLVHEFDDSSWMMLSAPATSISPNVLGGKVHLSRWQDDASADAVFEKYQGKAKIASIGAGEGYWAWLGQKATVRLSSDNLVRTPQTITLRNGGEGWNQIGNPFCYPVQLADSTINLWRWDEQQQGYAIAGNRMEPWTGYWIQVDSAMQMTIQNTPDFSGKKNGLSKRAKVASASNWRLQLIAGAAGYADKENFFGLSSAAKVGYDRSDYAEPPSMGDRVATFFVHEDWQRPVSKYAVDMRAPGPITHEWQFAVSRPVSSNDAQISIAGLESLPKEYHVYLFDRGAYTDLRKQAAYPCTSSHNPSYYRIIATQDPNYLEKVTAGYDLSQNFPNPCNPVTVIKYSVPPRWRPDGMLLDQKSRVRLSIYDCAGRLVIDLVNGAAAPGRYQAVWKGQDRNGKNVATGTYFYRMQAPGFHGAKKLILLK